MKVLRFTCLMLSVAVLGSSLVGCTKRPIQEIADARAAMKAAQENCVEYFLPKDYEEIGQLLTEAEKRDAEALESMLTGYKKARVAAEKSNQKSKTSMTKAADLIRRSKNDAERSIREAMYAIESAEKAGAKTHASAKLESAQAALVEAKNLFFVSTCGYSASIEKAKMAQIAADESIKETKEEKERLAKLEAERMARVEVERLAAKRATLETKSKPEAPSSSAIKATDKKEVEAAGARNGIPQVLTDYMVGKGETLWQISARKDVYGDPYLWPIIYKANRSQIKDPTQIAEGQKLTLPRNVNAKEIEEAVAEAKEKGLWFETGDDREKETRERKPASKE
ncbi:MAG: LysM peptidoglycan-binding domain-containing protein [Nitrospirota bacterium]|nr:LysM peptidoglycan-binding domain-containing protein [Nitrospirota bacterium]